MTGNELREKFLDFFAEIGHVVVPSSSLIPDDPSVLLTTAGMQQFKPFFLGIADPVKDVGARRAASIQKCFRTSDIDEVGDTSHLTFFEMLGHFSFGDYFKKETIEWTYNLLTDVFAIAPERISATVFAGDEKMPFDEESYNAWSKFLSPGRIRKGQRADNVWGPAGPEGPCGAANEVYVDNLEVATLVFMEYFCAKDSSLTKLPQKGVDVGWGFERLAMIVQDKRNIFETDLFAPLFKLLPTELPEREKRIAADHLRGSIFLLADGVKPSNKEAGYALRRLLRRILVYKKLYKIPADIFEKITTFIIHDYGTFYSELISEQKNIVNEYRQEHERFDKVLHNGLKEFDKRIMTRKPDRFGRIGTFHNQKILYGKDAFDLYQNFGFPREVMRDLAINAGGHFDDDGFMLELKKHQEISRAGAEKKFGGHGLLLDTGELKAANNEELQKVTCLHTATHVLHAALRKILGEGVQQMGSDITAERTRFDFSFDRKLTDDEKQQIENLVNDVINKRYDIEIQEMLYQEAIKQGALHFFKGKYPERVKIYKIGDFSAELCGGPHVKNTKEIGRFRILKEEVVASGVRRIRATVE